MKAALLLALALGCGGSPTPLLAIPLPPTATLADLDGTSFAPAARYRGQVVVLDFWAGWCDKCRAAIPAVKRLAAALGPEGLVVVGVNAGEAPDVARAAAAELALPYPVALDPRMALADQLGATDLPTLLVIDRAGVVTHRGREVDEAALAEIRRLLATPPLE